MSGYTVKQLLRWTLEQKLIDSYSLDENGEYSIRRPGESIHLPPPKARKLLISLLKQHEACKEARR